MPSIALDEDFEVIAANESVLFGECIVDYDDIDVAEGHEFLFNCPLKLVASKTDALSLIECHGSMLGLTAT